MSKVKALVSFSGQLTMSVGEERCIDNKEILDDLLQAKFIELVDEIKEVKLTKKGVKADESK